MSFEVLSGPDGSEAPSVVHGSGAASGTSDFVRITPLGSGMEVGRSCHILEYKGKTVMLDCGLHPGKTGLSCLPFLDNVDLSTVDLLLVSHFHVDHAAAVPYLLEKTSFKGRCFMTHPTKSIYKLILLDYVKVSALSAEETFYDEKDLLNSMEKIECLNFHQVVHHRGIKFWCYNAGHVLGAAMFMIEIAGVKILYTGDYSRREDRHLMSAEIPEVKPDILMVESTYGVQSLEPVQDREKRFTSTIHSIIKRGGRVLIPVFSLGRAQELLLILEEYWEANPSLQDFPIYYASALARQCMMVYQTYIHMMNKHIIQRFEISNPFIFKHISNLRGMDRFDDIGPSVVLASPGMLQNGLSRELFELWCSDSKNGCIIAGYSVEGTLARQIMSDPTHIKSLSGQLLPRNIEVKYISFSAHADYAETSSFIDILKPPHVILVHGEASLMLKLKQALQRNYPDGSIAISTPRNCQTVEIEFRTEKTAKIIGKLTKSNSELLEDEDLKALQPALEDGDIVSGLIVRKDFNDRILAVEDLPLYTPLSTMTINQSLKVPFHHTFETLKHFLGQIYEIEDDIVELRVDEMQNDLVSGDIREFKSLVVLDVVTVIYRVDPQCSSESHIQLEWESNPVSDMVCDSIVSLLLSIDESPGTAKLLGSQCHHEEHGENTHHHDHDQSPSDVSNGVSKQENESNSNSELIKEEDDSMVEYLTKKTKVDPEAELDLLGMVLSQIFSEQAITIDHAHRKILLSYDELSASVELDTHTVESEDIELKDRLLKVLKWTRVSFGPCPVLDEFNLHKSL